MDWLAQNWVLVFAAFIGMHLFGHGGHGGMAANRSRCRFRIGCPGVDDIHSVRQPPT